MRTISVPIISSLLIALSCGVTMAGEYTNFIGMKFRDIPTGSYYMGCCEPTEGKFKYTKGDLRCPSGTDNDFDNYASTNSAEYPQHKVTISKPFQMGMHEVTYGQFWKYVGATQPQRLENPPKKEDLNIPVVKVGWPGAQLFISWLNNNKPKNDTGTYRLPTEAEWEYSARAGSTDKFSWGKGMKKGMANCTDASACGSKWSGRKAPVGSFPPNKFGLYDMSGNVWEWVEDCWHDSYNGAPTDGSAWVDGECEMRTIRGGSGNDDPYFLRNAMRSSAPAEKSSGRNSFWGFRVVRTLLD
jgi:formylglycine-generating enzyme required for sulfatase activity